jgi:hypothetical protein
MDVSLRTHGVVVVLKRDGSGANSVNELRPEATTNARIRVSEKAGRDDDGA